MRNAGQDDGPRHENTNIKPHCIFMHIYSTRHEFTTVFRHFRQGAGRGLLALVCLPLVALIDHVTIIDFRPAENVTAE